MQACPAVNGLERRIIEIPAPFSLQMRCIEKIGGGFDIHLVPSGTRIDPSVVCQSVTIMPRETWRCDNAPVVQIALPHLFVSDSLTYLTQMPAWASTGAVQVPGHLIGGRFRADLWPRSLNLAFEWANRDLDFKMKRGQPACYLFPEIGDPTHEVHLVEGVMTEELRSYINKISDVVKFTTGTFSLLERASEIRPRCLLREPGK